MVSHKPEVNGPRNWKNVGVAGGFWINMLTVESMTVVEKDIFSSRDDLTSSEPMIISAFYKTNYC